MRTLKPKLGSTHLSRRLGLANERMSLLLTRANMDVDRRIGQFDQCAFALSPRVSVISVLFALSPTDNLKL